MRRMSLTTTCIIIYLMICCIHNLKAQSKLTFGLRTGIQISYFADRIGEYGQGDPGNYENDARLSGSFGTFLNYRFTPVVSVQLETYLSGRGGAYISTDPTITTIVIGQGSQKTTVYKRYGLNYLDVPLSLKFNINHLFKEKNVNSGSFFLTIGGGPSFLVSSTFIWNTYYSSGYGTNQVDEERHFDYFPYAEKIIMNGHIGLGYGNRVAYMELRYNSTLGEVYQVERLYNYNMKTSMSTLSFNIGFKLIPWRNE